MDEQREADARRQKRLEELKAFEPALLEFLREALLVAEKQTNMADKFLIGSYLEVFANCLRASKEMMAEQSAAKRFFMKMRLTKLSARHARLVDKLTEHKNLVDSDHLFNLLGNFIAKVKEVSPGFALHLQRIKNE